MGAQFVDQQAIKLNRNIVNRVLSLALQSHNRRLVRGLFLCLVLWLAACEGPDQKPETEARKVAELYCRCVESADKAKTQEQALVLINTCAQEADKTFEALLSSYAGLDMELQIRMRKAYKQAVDTCQKVHKEVQDAAGAVAAR